jgi:hypothetical protein
MQSFSDVRVRVRVRGQVTFSENKRSESKFQSESDEMTESEKL